MPTLNLPDLSLYYKAIGNGPPLLLIHGLGSSSRDWEKQVESFSKSFQVYAVDLRGHGRSDKPRGPYSISTFAGDIYKLISKLKLRSPHLVGISLGGMVAFELAVRYPNLLKSMVIVNGYPEMRVETLRERLMIWRRYLILELLGLRGTGMILGKHLFPNPEQADLRKLFVERWVENDKRAYRASLRAIVNWDVEDKLGEIRFPVLVVASEHDYMPMEEKQVYTAKMPNAELVVIENARHAVTAELPEQFNRVTMNFLQKIL